MSKQQLAIKYLCGEYTDTQFNFWCHQLKYDKEEIVKMANDIKIKSTWFNYGFIVALLAFIVLVIYLMIGG
jgi:hypothetical protein